MVLYNKGRYIKYIKNFISQIFAWHLNPSAILMQRNKGNEAYFWDPKLTV